MYLLSKSTFIPRFRLHWPHTARRYTSALARDAWLHANSRLSRWHPSFSMRHCLTHRVTKIWSVCYCDMSSRRPYRTQTPVHTATQCALSILRGSAQASFVPVQLLGRCCAFLMGLRMKRGSVNYVFTQTILLTHSFQRNS